MMKCLRISIAIAIGIILLQSTFAQTKAPAKKVSDKDKSAARLEAERLRKERQAEARYLLVALASDARSFRDQALRARALARIADALWEVDAEQARTLFRKAWEAAETANREHNERSGIRDGVIAIKPEDINVAAVSAIATYSDLRKEVLRIVVARDRTLAEELLEKLKESQADNKSENTSPSLWDLPDALQQRLSLAEDMLGGGNIEGALQLADPVLGHVTISTLNFLTQLRRKNPTAADQRYSAMLASTGNNMTSDANTVSLLSSYIFTPGSYFIYNSEGGASYSGQPNPWPVNVSPQLQLAFFQTASLVLLRPQPPPHEDQSSAGLAGKYMVVKQLLPLFGQHAPRDMAEAMRGQLEALNSLVSENVRRGETEKVPEEITEQEPSADREASLLEEIEHADTAAQRDDLYFKLALLALKTSDLKARDYAGKIEDSGFRKQAKAWVDWTLAVAAVSRKQTELALEINRTSELTHIQRVWILTHAAKLLAKADSSRASSLLDTAAAEARRIDGGDLDRPRGLFAVADAARVVDPARVSEAIFEAVKAANSTEGFTGEGGVVVQTMNSKTHIRVNPQNVPEFDVEGVFAALANDDYERAVQLARGFQAEAPRANATIAIARAVLKDVRTRAAAP